MNNSTFLTYFVRLEVLFVLNLEDEQPLLELVQLLCQASVKLLTTRHFCSSVLSQCSIHRGCGGSYSCKEGSMTEARTRPTVLVVDPDEDTLELVGEYLTARGMAVHTAYAPDEAIALVRSVSVDAVLTEVVSGTSGLDLVRLARGRARPAAVVVTMVGDSVELAVTTMKFLLFYVDHPKLKSQIFLLS